MSDQENGVARFAFYMVPAAMLLIALLPLPYGYYTLLRLVVCICAGIIVVTHFNHAEKISASVVVAFMIALVFNPIVPVYLKRGRVGGNRRDFSRSVWLACIHPNQT